MIISIIAALGKDRVIGNNNKLPWNLPADMEHFRKMTARKPIIMGQRTFESIGKALPGRINIVLTLDENFQAPSCLIARSIKEALQIASKAKPSEGGDETKSHRLAKNQGAKEVMICGGASVYKQFLPLADRMYLTLIEGDFEGDAYFPEFGWNDWQEVKRTENNPDKENPYKYTFVTLERKIKK